MSRAPVSKISLIGIVEADPETWFLPNGIRVACIALMTGETGHNPSGQEQESGARHRVIFYQKLAEIVGDYLMEGSKVYIEGSLRAPTWETSGEKHYSSEIEAYGLQMLDRRSESQARTETTKTRAFYSQTSARPIAVS